jgi:hypothetical protein
MSSEEAKTRAIKRMVAETMAKTKHPKARPARLDADGKAKPLTVFRGKKPQDGHCYDPTHMTPTELVHQDPSKR